MDDSNILPAKLPKEKVPGTYTWIAPLHDWLAVLVESKARRMGLKLAEIHDGDEILEVAVGTGLSFRHILKKNPAGFNTGVDLTPAMLKRAAKRAERSGRQNYRLLLGDAYRLDFTDDAFDLVINSYMFDLLPEKDFIPVLAEFKRVLKPGGRLVQINMTRGLAWYNQLWEGIYRIHPPLFGGCRGVMTLEALSKAGFERIERTYISQFTFPSEVLRGYKPGSIKK